MLIWPTRASGTAGKYCIADDHDQPSRAFAGDAPFCEGSLSKILFHRELADLGVQFLDLGSGIYFHGRRFPGKGRHHAFLGLTLPARDHRWRTSYLLVNSPDRVSNATLALHSAENFRRLDIGNHPPRLRSIA